MQSNRTLPPFANLLDFEEPEWKPKPSPPQLQRPVLITEDGDFAYITDEFTVNLSPVDPNAIRGIGKTIVICKQKGTERWR
jgi:hypothetical protein